ncbi:ELKS/Rab6-interacting/CAST family protein [Helicobacter pylori]|uniref:ELKS/Rab6-interacting/CAST family protein n=1 Tax=Helicobacter pylori TaxID=210 RepID=UPI001FD61E66|nr:ELKS/Rab6-interacting/CAST family protein [Helicobacter pylori]UOS57150.1 ELKS/Rab6-interacting/CAST family protein [Helicobacter pylori]
MKKIVVGWCVALAFLSADPAQADKAVINADLIKEIRDLKKIISVQNTEINNLRKVQEVLSGQLGDMRKDILNTRDYCISLRPYIYNWR